MLLLSFLPLLGSGGLMACASSGESQDHHEPALAQMTPDEVQAKLANPDGKFYVFDANMKPVFDAGHVPGAKWVPADAVTADMLPADKDATLLFYCANEH
jgi:3-mercaptopyruvate sulfurtransferase SseA